MNTQTSDVLTRQEIFQRIVKVIAGELRVDKSIVTPNASLERDLGVNSLNFSLVVVGIEDAFHIALPFEESLNISTVNDIVQLVIRILGEEQRLTP